MDDDTNPIDRLFDALDRLAHLDHPPIDPDAIDADADSWRAFTDFAETADEIERIVATIGDPVETWNRTDGNPSRITVSDTDSRVKTTLSSASNSDNSHLDKLVDAAASGLALELGDEGNKDVAAYDPGNGRHRLHVYPKVSFKAYSLHGDEVVTTLQASYYATGVVLVTAGYRHAPGTDLHYIVSNQPLDDFDPQAARDDLVEVTVDVVAGPKAGATKREPPVVFDRVEELVEETVLKPSEARYVALRERDLKQREIADALGVQTGAVGGYGSQVSEKVRKAHNTIDAVDYNHTSTLAEHEFRGNTFGSPDTRQRMRVAVITDPMILENAGPVYFLYNDILTLGDRLVHHDYEEERYDSADELVTDLYEDAYFNSVEDATEMRDFLHDAGFETASDPEARLNPDFRDDAF